MRNIYATLKYCILIPLLASCSVLDEDGLADGVGGNPSNAVYMGNVNRTGVIAVLAQIRTGPHLPSHRVWQTLPMFL